MRSEVLWTTGVCWIAHKAHRLPFYPQYYPSRNVIWIYSCRIIDEYFSCPGTNVRRMKHVGVCDARRRQQAVKMIRQRNVTAGGGGCLRGSVQHLQSGADAWAGRDPVPHPQNVPITRPNLPAFLAARAQHTCRHPRHAGATTANPLSLALLLLSSLPPAPGCRRTTHAPASDRQLSLFVVPTPTDPPWRPWCWPSRTCRSWRIPSTAQATPNSRASLWTPVLCTRTWAW